MKSNTLINTIKWFAAVFAAAVFATGCSKDDKPAMKLSADMALDDVFGSGMPATAGMYLYYAGQEENDPVQENIMMKLDAGKYESDRQLVLDTDQRYDVRLYAPYSENAADGGCIQANVPADQSAVEDFGQYDHVYACADNTGVGEGTVRLAGEHLVCQVEILVDATDGYGSTSDGVSGVVLRSFFNGSSVRLKDGYQETDGEASDIYARLVHDGQTAVARAFAVPQRKSAGSPMFTVSGDGFSVEINADEDIVFERGKKYTFSISLSTGMIAGFEVSGWDENFTGNEMELYPDIEEVYDVDGNRYGVTVIDGMYWMSDNLKTTRLNDGTPLDIIFDANEWARWGFDDNMAACYYDFGTDDAVGKGMFYTWSVVKTGKLCPYGWRVPSRDEWLAMREYAGGEYMAGTHLKTTEGWKDAGGQSKPEYQGDDIYGFHALPSGYVNDRAVFDHTEAGYGSESLAYYWSSSESTEIRPYFYTIYYMAPNLVEDTSPVTNYGMSVRCIRDIK